jgi:hypothetical protein
MAPYGTFLADLPIKPHIDFGFTQLSNYLLDTRPTLPIFQVLADQALWAVCGRAAGVIDMETAGKQTLLVEVMPLTGGHLALPKVRLSKYIPPTSSALMNTDNTSSSNLKGTTKTWPLGQKKQKNNQFLTIYYI